MGMDRSNIVLQLCLWCIVCFVTFIHYRLLVNGHLVRITDYREQCSSTINITSLPLPTSLEASMCQKLSILFQPLNKLSQKLTMFSF